MGIESIFKSLSKASKNFAKAFGDMYYARHAPENVRVSIPELVSKQEVTNYTHPTDTKPMYADLSGNGKLYGVNEVPEGAKVAPVLNESGKMPDVLDASQGSIVGLTQDPYATNAGRATLLNTIAEESINGSSLAKIEHPEEVPGIAEGVKTEAKQAEQIAPAVMLENTAEGNAPYLPTQGQEALEAAAEVKTEPQIVKVEVNSPEFEKDLQHNAILEMREQFAKDHPEAEKENVDYAVSNILGESKLPEGTPKIDLQEKYGVSNDYAKPSYSNVSGIIASDVFSPKTKAIAQQFVNVIPDSFERHTIEAVGNKPSALTPFNDHLFREIVKVDKAIKRAPEGSLREKFALNKMVKLMKQETVKQYQTALTALVEPSNQGAIDKSAIKALKNVLKDIKPETDTGIINSNLEAFRQKFYDNETFKPSENQQKLLNELNKKYPLKGGSVEAQLEALLKGRMTLEEAKELFGRVANNQKAIDETKIGSVPESEQVYIPGVVGKEGHIKRIGNTVASPLFARTYELLQGVLHHPSNIDKPGANFFDRKHHTEAELKALISPLAHDQSLRNLYLKVGGDSARKDLQDLDNLRLDPNSFKTPRAFYGALEEPGSDVDKFHRMAERLNSNLQAAADIPILDALHQAGDIEITRLLDKLYKNPVNSVAANIKDIGAFLMSNPRLASKVQDILERVKPDTTLLEALGEHSKKLSKYAETDFNEYTLNLARAMQTRSNVKALPTVIRVKDFGKQMMSAAKGSLTAEDLARIQQVLGPKDAEKFLSTAKRAGSMNSLGTYWNTVPTPEQFGLRSLSNQNTLSHVHMLNSANVPEIMDRFTGREMSTLFQPGDAFSTSGEMVLNRSAHPLLGESGERNIKAETLYGRDPALGGLAQLAQDPLHRAIEWSPEHVGTLRARGVRDFVSKVLGKPLDLEGEGIPKAIVGKTYTEHPENLADLPYALSGKPSLISDAERVVRGKAIESLSEINNTLEKAKGRNIAVAKIAESLITKDPGLSIEEAAKRAVQTVNNIHNLSNSIEPGLKSAEFGVGGPNNRLVTAARAAGADAKTVEYLSNLTKRIAELGENFSEQQAEKAVQQVYKKLSTKILEPVLQDLGFEDSSHFVREALESSPMKSEYHTGDLTKIFADNDSLQRWLSVADFTEKNIAVSKIRPATKAMSSRLNIDLGPELKANQVSLPFTIAKDLASKAFKYASDDTRKLLKQIEKAKPKEAHRLLQQLFKSDALEVIREPKWLQHSSELEIVIREPSATDNNRLRIPEARAPYSNADFDGDTLTFSIFGREYDLEPKSVIPEQKFDENVEESVPEREGNKINPFAVAPTQEVVGHMYRTLAQLEDRLPITETGQAIRDYLEKEALTRSIPTKQSEEGFQVHGAHQVGQQLKQHATNVKYMQDPLRAQRLKQAADYIGGKGEYPEKMRNYTPEDLATGLNPYVSAQQGELTKGVTNALARSETDLPEELKTQYSKILAEELFSEIQNPSSSVVHTPTTPVSDRASSKRAIPYHREFENLPVEELEALGYDKLNELLTFEAPGVQKSIINSIKDRLPNEAPAFVELSRDTLGAVNDTVREATGSMSKAQAGAGGIPYEGLNRYYYNPRQKLNISRPEDLYETAAALINKARSGEVEFPRGRGTLGDYAQLVDILSNNGIKVQFTEPIPIAGSLDSEPLIAWGRLLKNVQREHAGLDKLYEDVDKQRGATIWTRNPVARIYGRKNVLAYLTPEQEALAKGLPAFSRPIGLGFPQTRETNAAIYTPGGQKLAVSDLVPFNDAGYLPYLQGETNWLETANKARYARESNLRGQFKGSSRH